MYYNVIGGSWFWGGGFMEMKAVMENVISLFLIILVGIYGVKKKIINDEI